MTAEQIQQIIQNAQQAMSDKQYDLAEQSLMEILQIFPEHFEAKLLLARLYFLKGNYQRSYHCLVQLLRDRQSAEVYYLLGKNAEKLQTTSMTAIDWFQQAVRLDPSAENRFALILAKQNKAQKMGEYVQIALAYDAFLRDYPNHILALHNRSAMLTEIGLYDLALKEEKRVLSLSPEFAMGWCHFAMLSNLLGNYKEGWAAYEWRWKTDVSTFKDLGWPIPRWQGQDIGNQKLLIYAEQGFGDNIQFVRYAIEAKKRGMNILVVNHSAVENLLNENLARYGIETLKNGTGAKGIAYYVSMMSLPYYFGTTLENIPCPQAYLQAQPAFVAKFSPRITNPSRLKVGVMWSGSAQHSRNQVRSVPFEQIKSLFEFDAEFHCLQKEISEQDKQQLASIENVTLHDSEINDFSDTAGLIANMDLVISVDTAVAHLSAALGKPTWIMLSYRPDFRWLLNREDSPWYENVRLFRQGIACQWREVMFQIADELANKIKEYQYA